MTNARGLVPGEDGYDLWLRYAALPSELARTYAPYFRRVLVAGDSPTMQAVRSELAHALARLLPGETVDIESREGGSSETPGVVIGTSGSCAALRAFSIDAEKLGPEGFVVMRRPSPDGGDQVVVAGSTEIGALYGAFYLLRQIGRGRPPEALAGTSAPRVKLRLLNHWDNLDGTIERGYAGWSLWNWFELPDIVSPRLVDYSRALASIGLNGSVLTNVNANALVLSRQYLEKVKALADVMRPYGVRVYLTARFNAPMELSKLPTADPEDARVQIWWQEKCDEIHRLIPDFGGFVVKANSEGQPGPQDYHRTHAQGANLLAKALAPHGGVVIWRAFVYDGEVPVDRATQAYSEFVPLDGEFLPNVLVQVKNGPIDFQPREPHHPLFGAMERTPLIVEFQLTQEYLGNSTHLCYLGSLFSEVLQQRTFHRSCAPEGDSRVSRVADGTMKGTSFSGMSAVSNIGSDANWCGHHFAQGSLYAYGRLCWDPDLDPDLLAREWLEQTFCRDGAFVEPALKMMMDSHQAVVDYMTPLGLHHIMGYDHHQGPAPWIDQGRPDWTCVYYHRADEEGLGFDRTTKGSDALAQYPEPYRRQMESLATCPLDYLLWYHHVPWDHELSTKNTLWDELCLRYQRGVESARRFRATWSSLAPFVDPLRHAEVAARLERQERDAVWWKDACLGYFQTWSKRPFPEGVEPPLRTLSEYQSIEHYYVPGIPERRFS